jgi:ABC-type glutathione transport system ATPase component
VLVHVEGESQGEVGRVAHPGQHAYLVVELQPDHVAAQRFQPLGEERKDGGEPAPYIVEERRCLSGGQRQRVVIARALAAQPELIVADEPISSLDVSIRAEILELLNNLVHDSDVGILYITHDLLSARMLSDEVIVLNEGQVVEAGPSLRVIRQPEDEYTRRLLEAIPNPFQDAQRPGDSMAG